MKFINSLKRICDICFAMTFTTIIGGFIGVQNLIISLPLFALVVVLGIYLTPKGWVKYFSLLPLAAVWLLVDVNFATIIVLAPAVVYLLICLNKPINTVLDFEYEATFKIFIGIFGWILFFVVITSTLSPNQTSLPIDSYLFGLTFITNAIILSRMIRHDVSVYQKTKFKIISASPLIFVVVMAIILSNEFLWTVVRNIFGFVFIRLILPVLEFITFLVAFPLAFLGSLFIGGVNNTDELTESSGDVLGDYPLGLYLAETDTANDFAVILATAILFTIFIALVIVMIKTFQSKIITINSDGEVEETRTSLTTNSSTRQRRILRSENKIRKIYHNFLTFVTKNEITVPATATSAEIENQVKTKFNLTESNDLRTEYIRVRYGESNYNQNDVIKAKNLYKKFKHDSKADHQKR